MEENETRNESTEMSEEVPAAGADEDGKDISDMMGKEERQVLADEEKLEEEVLAQDDDELHEAEDEDEDTKDFHDAAQKLADAITGITKEHKKYTIMGVIGTVGVPDENSEVNVRSIPLVTGYSYDMPFLVGNLLSDELPRIIREEAGDALPEGTNRAERRRAERERATIVRRMSCEFFTNMLTMFCIYAEDNNMIRGLKDASVAVLDSYLSGSRRGRPE